MNESQKKAIKKYKEKLKRLTIDFSPAESEMWEHITKQPKKQTYIKDLIRKDMQGEEAEWICESTEKTYFEALIQERCSFCGRKVTRTGKQPKVKFCPNCGSKMKQKKEG